MAGVELDIHENGRHVKGVGSGVHMSREESSLSVPRVWTIAAIWINFQLPMRRHTRCIILHLGLVVVGWAMGQE